MNDYDYKILAEHGFEVLNVPMVKFPDGTRGYELRVAKDVSLEIQRAHQEHMEYVKTIEYLKDKK